MPDFDIPILLLTDCFEETDIDDCSSLLSFSEDIWLLCDTGSETLPVVELALPLKLGELFKPVAGLQETKMPTANRVKNRYTCLFINVPPTFNTVIYLLFSLPIHLF